ncbi:hypothetical protein [Nocardia nova]|uniref:hypothetical protein n=1 Tax=Nocardia nova TaxID=37330 RepID=UPI0033DED40F
MKIRLTGTLPELREAGALLGQVFDVLELSEPCPNRGASTLYRLYVEPGSAPSATSRNPLSPSRCSSDPRGIGNASSHR